jgi:glycerol uptake facilitator-like aquaporin
MDEPTPAGMTSSDLPRRLAGEALGTAFLLATVVGSGIMGERLAGGNVAIALLANALATAAVLYVLIEWFGPISGAHFNPLVTMAMAARGDLIWLFVPAYVVAQIIGAIAGVAIADRMFELPVFAWSQHVRFGPGQWLSEFVATFGLLGVIWVCSRTKPSAVGSLVAAYIGGAYWFTASTSFANPAVTIARALTDTFAGIRPADVPPFLAAQGVGTIAAIAVFGWLIASKAPSSEREEKDRDAPFRLTRTG